MLQGTLSFTTLSSARQDCDLGQAGSGLSLGLGKGLFTLGLNLGHGCGRASWLSQPVPTVPIKLNHVVAIQFTHVQAGGNCAVNQLQGAYFHTHTGRLHI